MKASIASSIRFQTLLYRRLELLNDFTNLFGEPVSFKLLTIRYCVYFGILIHALSLIRLCFAQGMFVVRRVLGKKVLRSKYA